jgi:hypothetical protein
MPNSRRVVFRIAEGVIAGIIASILVSLVIFSATSPFTQPDVQVSSHYEENGDYIISILNSGNAPSEGVIVNFSTPRTDHHQTKELDKIGRNQVHQLKYPLSPVRRNITDTRTNLTILNSVLATDLCEDVSRNKSILIGRNSSWTSRGDIFFHKNGVIEYKGVEAVKVRKETYRRKIVEPTLHTITVQREGESRPFIHKTFNYPESSESINDEVILNEYTPSETLFWKNENGCIIDDEPVSNHIEDGFTN